MVHSSKYKVPKYATALGAVRRGRTAEQPTKWCGYTDIEHLGNDQSDKQSQKATQCLPREGQEQGFPVKGTGEYGVEGTFSNFVVWLRDSVSSCINKTVYFECLQYVPTQGD